MKSFKELIEEGWGASAQKRELEKHRGEWDALLKQFAKNNEVKKKLMDLKMKNYKAAAAKAKLKL